MSREHAHIVSDDTRMLFNHAVSDLLYPKTAHSLDTTQEYTMAEPCKP